MSFITKYINIYQFSQVKSSQKLQIGRILYNVQHYHSTISSTLASIDMLQYKLTHPVPESVGARDTDIS